MLVFVYGTLKKGKPNHDFMEESEYRGKYFTDNSFTLVVGGLPFLVKRKGQGAMGEVYEVDKETLRALDRLEGHPGFYRREKIWVTNADDGSQLEAYAYLHPDTFTERDFQWDVKVMREY